MRSIIDQRHDIVKKAVMQRPDAVVEVTVLMWERLAVELISIIGEEGFQSLYIRSGHLNSTIFPWLLLEHTSSSSDSRFADLQICLESRDASEVSAASEALFITFVDILALLIGDLLTASILRSAWIDDTFELVAKGNTK
jgi:general stress protein CsbA